MFCVLNTSGGLPYTRSTGARVSRPNINRFGENPVASCRDDRYARITKGNHSSQSL